MSVSKCYTIHCNHCAQWVQGLEDQPLAHFRVVAARMGWTSAPRLPGHRTTQNWCPKCSLARRENAAKSASIAKMGGLTR